jgi:protein TonB
MPKMTHAIEGWFAESGPLILTPEAPRQRPAAISVPARPGLWKYRTLHQSRWIMAFSILFSAGLHALALLGFNERKIVAKPARVADEPIIQMVMPDLREEEIDPVENLSEEEPIEAPSITVPLLADVPSIVPIDSFVQPLDFTPALPANLDAVRLSAVPVNVARNSGAVQRLGKIFDVAQLDRQPEPTLQPSPIFPAELRKEYDEAAVLLEFIITSKGEVFAPRSLASAHRRFEEAAIKAVEKWRFRPGYKSGRPVNTRTQITIKFRVEAD